MNLKILLCHVRKPCSDASIIGDAIPTGEKRTELKESQRVVLVMITSKSLYKSSFL